MNKKILSMLLALAMVFTMVPAAFAAEPAAVADFAALKTAVTAGGIVKLTADITATETLVIASGIAVELDLAGFDITGSLPYDDAIFEVSAGGKLTINDADNNGCITNNGDYGHAIFNVGELIVNGGTITGDYALYNGEYTSSTASATLNGGVFGSNPAGGYSVINCGILTVAGATINDYANTSGTFTMSAGYVEGMFATSADAPVESDVRTTISGGELGYLEVASFNNAVENNEVTIAGGKIDTLDISEQEGSTAVNDVAVTAGEIGEVRLYSIDAADDRSYSDAADAEGLEISGGTFEQLPPDSVIDPAKDVIIPEGGQGFKVGDIDDAQAMDPASGTYYEDAADAFAVLDEVILNPNMPEGAEIVVPEGKNAYVDSVDPANKVEPGKYVADANGELAPAVHVHKGDGWFNSDAAAHWEKCAVCGENLEFLGHGDANGDGYCDTCGWIMNTPAGRQNPSTGVSFGLPCR